MSEKMKVIDIKIGNRVKRHTLDSWWVDVCNHNNLPPNGIYTISKLYDQSPYLFYLKEIKKIQDGSLGVFDCQYFDLVSREKVRLFDGRTI